MSAVVVIAYLSGLATIPLLAGLWSFFVIALARDIGSGGCFVCEHYKRYEIGEQYHFQSWIRMLWHRWFWGKRAWHKAAWAAHHFNPNNRITRDKESE